MIIDRTHIGWGIATGIATVGVTVVYLANNDPGLLPFAVPLPGWLGPVPPLRGNIGSTPLGLIYGTLALAIFLFAALLGWRRNHPSWRIGPIQLWLKAHIWLTLFTIPLVLLHCGFRGGGPMTQFLLTLYAVVMASGFWGLFLQHVIPKLMREYLPDEVIFEQIPYIRSQLIAQAQAIHDKLIPAPIDRPVAVPVETANVAQPVATVAKTQPAVAAAVAPAAVAAAVAKAEDAAPVAVAVAPAAAAKPAPTVAPPVTVPVVLEFMDREALPYLNKPGAKRFRLRDKRISDDVFRLLKLQAPISIHPALEQLQDLCDEKRRLDFQTRLQHWLHGWLLVHAPTSILLLILTFWHAVVAVFLYA